MLVKIVSMLLLIRFNIYDSDQHAVIYSAHAIHDMGQQAILECEHAIHDRA